MNNKLQLFEFNSQPVRVVWINSDPMPIFADTCKCLKIGNPSEALKRLLFPDGVSQAEVIDRLGRTQVATVISLPNYLDFVARSDAAMAVPFREWVFGEVLPAIFKTGSYSMEGKSPKEQLQDQLGMLQFVHKVVRGVFRALSQRGIVENKQLALYGKVAFDYFRLEVGRANRQYTEVIKYFHGDNVLDEINVKGDIVKMQAEIKNGEVSVQMHMPFGCD